MASSTGGLDEDHHASEREVVKDVMNTCGCTETEALKLLKHSDNNAKKAKRRHKTLLRFMPQVLPEGMKPPVPLKNPLLDTKLQLGTEPNNFSERDSDEECHYDTPRTDGEPVLHPSRASRQSSKESGAATVPRNLQDEAHQTTFAPSVKSKSGNSEGLDPQSDKQLQQSKNAIELPRSNETASMSSEQKLQTTDEILPTESAEAAEWDFVLPRIPMTKSLVPGIGNFSEIFDLENLTGAMQLGANEQILQSYLRYFDQSTVQREINRTVEGFPSIFYAVETNNDWIVRTFIALGADVNAIHEDLQVPLLAFAITHSETILADTTHVVATLLSLGAFTYSIPAAFYTPYCRDLPDEGPDIDSLGDLSTHTRKWLTAGARAKLARTANLTQRYNLERAAKTKKPSVRHKYVAKLRNAEPLLGLPYFLIGQSNAANRLLQKCLSYLAIPSKKPLVLTFAGPSGHGKTELARRLGYLMSLELEVVDCTIVNREIELFGPRHPYMNADVGSSLNNFLTRNSGKRSIVFLDEFEKTTKEIHSALLLPFDNGEYQDRRKSNNNKIDCSKTIWILATNALDLTISAFCQQNEQAIFYDEDEIKKAELMKALSKELKEDSLLHFGAPITGRVSEFIPFLHFSPGEQAVVAHKYLLELGQSVRDPVKLTPGQENLVGNVHLRVRRDASVCSKLAVDGYHRDLGARSLITAVSTVRELLVDAYLGVDEAITEQDDVVEFLVDVNGGEVVTNLVQAKA